MKHMTLQQEMDWLARAQASSTPDEFESFLKATMGTYNTLVKDAVLRDGALFCPDCAAHEQRSNDPATHYAHGDCKNLIGTIEKHADGDWMFVTKDQCACRGPAHGVRKGWY